MKSEAEYGRVLAVDVCGTLYETNTTAGLVLTYHRIAGNLARFYLVRLISSRKLPFTYLLTLIRRITGVDLHRLVTILTLRGSKQDELAQSAHVYLEQLAKLKVLPVHNLLHCYESHGWNPILISNSLSDIVRPIARQLGYPFLASELEWKNGRCTGFLAVDLTGSKLSHLRDWLNGATHIKGLTTLTDNKSDVDLIAASEEAIVVCHGKKRKWMNSVNAQILYIRRK